MRTTHYLLATLKENPSDAEIISHKLMTRAGMIRKTATGIYSWLPLGLRVLKKVEAIVRDEMNKAGALEILMPAIQPAELWQETQRWELFGSELLKIKDRQAREYCFGPTHEEIVTDIMRRELRSYKQLPLTLYQIQMKFRDEIRPRFGVMRAREFLMKDAYSFHVNKASLQETYQIMYQAYTNIFTRLGLEFRAVLADTGSIGGSVSHEFHVLAHSGEDIIAYSDASDYAANIELATSYCVNVTEQRKSSENIIQTIATPGKKTIAEVSQFLNINPEKILKTLLVKGSEAPIIALILRGDHELNPVKLAKISAIAQPLTFIHQDEIQTTLDCNPGYLGPIGLAKANIPMIIDQDASVLSDFVCGANHSDEHLINVNWERDVALGEIADLRKVVEGDQSPDGKGTLKMVRGIEVGHIFQLGNKYSKAMQANVLDENGKNIAVEMGCYGIGVSRIVAAAIEQNHDEYGIIWPDALAPFQVCIVPINLHQSESFRTEVEKIYQKLVQNNIEVLLDDRDERPGLMFADMDLIGIPHRITINEKNLKNGLIEYKHRRKKESQLIKLETIIELLTSRL